MNYLKIPLQIQKNLIQTPEFFPQENAESC